MTPVSIAPPQHQESETLEFKQDATLETLAPSVVAMLNRRGGMILVGYSDTGQYIGLPGDAVALAQRLTEQLSQAITPKEFFQIMPQENEGKIGLVIEVPSGAQKPYVYDGRIYVREGASNRPATAALLSRLIAERENTDERWERRPAVGVEADTLDSSEIRRTVQAVTYRYATPAIEQETVISQLDRLELMQDGWPTQAAIVLFLTEKARVYTQAGVRAVAFGDTLARVRDEKSLLGGSFLLFERLMAFFEANLPRASALKPGTTLRAEMPVYPVTVIREAVVNALIHRDYQDTASIQVRLFLDRLEIWNPGRLPAEYIQEAASFTVSRPGNPDIARIFHLRGYAEMLGIGLRRIREEMAQAGLPPPVWSNEGGGVLLTLACSAEKASSGDNSKEELLPRLQAFLAATSPSESITRTEYQSRFAPYVSERSARNDLQTLLKQGYLRRVGHGYYRAYVRTEKAWEEDHEKHQA
jgi:ATP-dependent DNA helicase RecG